MIFFFFDSCNEIVLGKYRYSQGTPLWFKNSVYKRLKKVAKANRCYGPHCRRGSSPGPGGVGSWTSAAPFRPSSGGPDG
eukprot:228127-Pyramimonas_sp.AAC.1